MARQAQPDDLVFLVAQALSQCPQAVGRIAHAMQQQYATAGLIREKFEAELGRRSLRMTKQREVILEAAFSSLLP